MSVGSAEVLEQYSSYLIRFDEALGPTELGAYAKHRGRLIKKLRYDEFAAKLKEFQDADAAYREIVANGDTINDMVMKVLRERADELLLAATPA